MGSATTATTKSKATRRFLLCFKSDVQDDDAAAASAIVKPQRCRSTKDSSAGDVLTYISVGEKEGVVFPNVLPVLKPAKEPDAAAVSRRRKESRSTLSKILRAVMFETSLAKKMRKRKNRNKSFQQEATKPTTSLMKKTPSESEIGGLSLTETMTGSSSSSFNVGSASSMCASSVISSSRSSPGRSRASTANPVEQKQPQNRKKQPQSRNNQGKGGGGGGFKNRYSIATLCLIILSLIAVIFWGKACAIICTSACLFVVPRLSRPRDEFSPPNSVPVSGEINPEEYKKRMGGIRGRC